ncbi:MAG: adenosylcobinamide-phosphate synthase CbiB [Bacillota bacterium]
MKILFAYFMDLLIGDPYWLPHPIVLIGNCIKALERILRSIFKTELQEKIAGVILTGMVVGGAYIGTWLLIKAAFVTHPYLADGIEAFLMFQILAIKSLDKESRKVYDQLNKGDLLEARKFLSYIVGRDTTDLDEQNVARGAVETVAENISDGIIAPMLYMIIGGVPLGMAYKAVNTLDSMVGYKNDRYIHFGWASARFDDIANWIPARLTAVFIIIASYFSKYHWKNSVKILLRDRRNHKSPNSGYPEAAVAGALGIQIGGTNMYFGKPVYKPTIGDANKVLCKEDILHTIRIMYMTSLIGIVSLLSVQYLVKGIH